jgi:hypothetical protein
MSAVTVTPITLSPTAFTTETTSNDFVAVDATDGALFTVDGTDKYIIVAKNACETAVAKTVTVVAGDGIHGALGNVTKSLAQNAISYLPIIEVNQFLNHSGTNKGKISVTGTDANIQIKVIKLP